MKAITGALLSSKEALSVKLFEVVQTTNKKRKTREEAYASQLLRSRGKMRSPTSSMTQYMPLGKIIPPTSNIVERQFSKYKPVQTPQHRSKYPTNFKQLATRPNVAGIGTGRGRVALV
ncbi:hypothetical protein F442_08325 [Phytophthora nicotianae P10297]|uniref:Uncharacterized protein n=1 Tax=Phytophthora nicotianae P10297 TaxID=1317064 RepID=W2ZD35_PHYNI|nr:hypothetical protein F442_08325 [Phytophthora nicotianae P10297]